MFNKLISSFFSFFFVSISLFSQNILQKAETGFVKFYVTSAKSSSAFDFNGNLYPTGNYSEVSSNFFLKYGFSDNLTISADFPFYKTYSLNNLNVSGFGDPVVGFTIGFNPENPLLFAISANMLIPIGSSGQFDNPIPVGWEEYQTQVKLQFHYQSMKVPVSVSGYAGGTLRGNNKNNDLIFGLGSDWKIIESLKLVVDLDNKFTIGKIRTTPPELNGAANGLGYLFITTGVNFKLYSAELSYSYRSSFYAQNITSAGINSFGVGFSF